ncbi:hypothetical protein [Flavobacterium lindanitolerans]|uniref:hypothetical protein n=1 Tax=Flavobacterium lindanitolerans TaxID=428988 RepID=UPI0027B9D271|nr:hypothetical protein [Flavobacterium lindanitolerans]
MKQRLFIYTVFLVFSNNIFAHKDIFFVKTYGNVKIYLKTGFEYSEIEKMKVIGVLSEKLSKKLNCKDTLLIEYVNDYAERFPEEIYSFENNNTNLKFINDERNDFRSAAYIQVQQGYYDTDEIDLKEKNYGISLRINADKIDIGQVLKLVEYSIRNRKSLKLKLEKKQITLPDWDNDSTYVYSANIIPKKLFNLITSGKSDFAEEIIKEKTKIETEMYSKIDIYWSNNEFLFEIGSHYSSKKRLFKIKDYYYYTYINPMSLLVFVDKENFYYLHNENISETLIHIDNGTFWPFQVISRFGKQLILFNNFNKINLFLIDKNKVISEFE